MRYDRSGFTLPELLVALTITAVLGAALTGLLVSQTRFFDTQEQLGNARAVSRGAINLMFNELRMVEASGGVVDIGDAHITVRAPYAFGLACGVGVGQVVVSMLPVDSVRFADAVFGGWAYRTGLRLNNPYEYVTENIELTSGVGGATVCSTARITTLTAEGGRIMYLGPAVALVEPGVPIFLYEHIRYRVDKSEIAPGAFGLYRDVLKSADDAEAVSSEEVVAPIEDMRMFRYYLDTDQTPVPASSVTSVARVRGVEISVPAVMERRYWNQKEQSLVQTPTSVFFMNRTD